MSLPNEVQQLNTELRELSVDEQQAAVRARIEQREREFYGAAQRSGDKFLPNAAPAAPRSFRVGAPPAVQSLPSWRDHLEVHDANAVMQLDASMSDDAAARELHARRSPELDRLLAAETAASIANAGRHAALAQSDAERRERLRLAIADHTKAIARVAEADAALIRAGARADSATRELGTFSELQAELTAHEVAQARAGTNDPMPQALAHALSQRSAVVDRIDLACKAVQVLQDEARQARAVLDSATQWVSVAAGHVVLGMTDVIAHQLAQLDELAAELRGELHTYAGTWLTTLGGGTSLLGVSARAHEVMLADRRVPAVDAAYSRKIKDWHVRLLSNADATLADDDDGDATR
jgi:hypothetical protein